MISIVTLVCLGGVSYMYTRFFYFTCCTNETAGNASIIGTTNSREIVESERSSLINRNDETFSIDDDDEENNLAEDNISSYPWIHKSRQIPTFKNQNCIVTFILNRFTNTLQPKTVRFRPFSEEHVTFSKKEYQRKNHEFFENLKKLHQNPAQLAQIYRELNVFRAKMSKLKTIHEHHDEELQEDFA